MFIIKFHKNLIKFHYYVNAIKKKTYFSFSTAVVSLNLIKVVFWENNYDVVKSYFPPGS